MASQPFSTTGTSLEVTLVLCDAAQVSEGKLSVLGGGWTRITANTPKSQALGVIVYVPYGMDRRRFGIELRLLDFDCRQLSWKGHPVVKGAQLEVSSPAGMGLDEDCPCPMVFEFNGLAFEPGGYVWECRVDGDLKAIRPFRAI